MYDCFRMFQAIYPSMSVWAVTGFGWFKCLEAFLQALFIADHFQFCTFPLWAPPSGPQGLSPVLPPLSIYLHPLQCLIPPFTFLSPALRSWKKKTRLRSFSAFLPPSAKHRLITINTFKLIDSPTLIHAGIHFCIQWYNIHVFV